MKAMILAAGRGERMRPLTDEHPKPLLKVGGKSLIEYHLENLAAGGIKQVVINTAWLAEQLRSNVGDGSRWGLHIAYSNEGWPALETGGGIYKALPLLGDQPFLVIAGDVWTDWRLTAPQLPVSWRPHTLAHLMLVPNPQHHVQGDFGLKDGRVLDQPHERYTYSGIGFYHPDIFKDCSAGAFKLAPLIYAAVHNARVNGELFTGQWSDIGTPERLQRLHIQISNGW